MTRFTFQRLEIFMSGPLLGNPLAVVVGRCVDSNEMVVANWTTLCATTFL
jgi:predicted PhzF superfamily epimerase YddE/YHI9